MYYLNSRYYSPTIGRFISSDGLLGEQGDILGHNMYAYTKNNPVMHVDYEGKSAVAVLLTGGALLLVLLGTYMIMQAIGVQDYSKSPALPSLKDLNLNMDEMIKIFRQNARAAMGAIILSIASKAQQSNNGTYVIYFASGEKYVGKGGIGRMIISGIFWSVNKEKDVPIYGFIEYSSSRREAFKREYELMCILGYNPYDKANDGMYNRIWSPGRTYYYQDNQSYHPLEIE